VVEDARRLGGATRDLRQQTGKRVGGLRGGRVGIVGARLEQGGKGGARVVPRVLLEIELVEAVDADQQDVALVGRLGADGGGRRQGAREDDGANGARHPLAGS